MRYRSVLRLLIPIDTFSKIHQQDMQQPMGTARLFFYLTLTLSSLSFSFGFQVSNELKNSARVNVSRRDIISGILASAAIAKSSSVLAKDDNMDMIDVYFGCGCFWHVQHELVEAERRILNRDDESLTARVGYAGGYPASNTRFSKITYKNVCYPSAYTPNPLHGDYRKLGYAEVVSLNIPQSKLSQFVMEYIDLFDQDGNRPDQVQDRGSPYRNLIGLPGGADSSYYKQITKVSSSKSIEFRVGKGYDDDVKGVSFVMDTAEFPFVIGERYHQFHDGFFKGEDYPDSYNEIAQFLKQKGTLGSSSCPNGALGIGIAGW